MKRPGKPIRVFILVAAVACLGLAMCHSAKKVEVPAERAASGSADPAPQPAAASGAQQANPPAQKPKPKQPYFPATKSAGPLR